MERGLCRRWKRHLYNPSKAKEEFAKAKADLQAQGVEFPIHLDLPTSSTYTEGIKQAQSFKQSIESTLGSRKYCHRSEYGFWRMIFNE